MALPATLLRGQPRVGRHGAIVDGAPEARDRLDAVEPVDAEWDQRGEVVIRRSVSEQEKADGGGAMSVDDAQSVDAGAGGGLIEIQRSSSVEVSQRRRCGQNDDARISFGRPIYRRFGSAEGRTNSEIAAPSVDGFYQSAARLQFHDL